MEGKLVTGVRSTVNDVEGGAREDKGGFDSCEICEVLVQRNAFLSSTSLRDGNRNTENGICTKLALVGCIVELDEEVVDFFLRGDLQARTGQLWSDDAVDVVDSLAYACKSSE